MSQIDFQQYILQGFEAVIEYAPKFLMGLALLWIGLKVINVITRSIESMMTSREVDVTLRPFLLGLLSWTLKFALFIVVANQVGINTMSFMAIFGAAGLAVGLALQGTLSNFASGVMLLVFRPFKVGDFLDVAGHKGTVEEIGIFVTSIRSPQNQLIIIPNSAVGSGSLTNFSNADKIQARLSIGISYDANIQQAREVILGVLAQDERILQKEGMNVFVVELADTSVNLSIRFWTIPGDNWSAHFHNLEAIKIAFDAAKIEIPYPQRVVHNA